MTSLAALALTLALAAPDARSPRVEALTAAVDAARLQATVARLVGFGTRHTLSETASETRGIGAARRWLVAEVAALASAPGSRLRPFDDRFTAEPAPRIPRPVELWNVGALLPGTDPARAKEAIVLTAHYDSRASDIMDASGDAPGAVDDGSGVAMVLELARVMARERPAVAVYFVAVAGEEQGLTGSTHLARRLAAEGIQVLAMVSVDTVGNTEGQDGVKDDVSVRVFSEGVSTVETEAARKLREAVGGENDGLAREWARYVKRVGERYVENLDFWIMLRRDRIARGSDHASFSRARGRRHPAHRGPRALRSAASEPARRGRPRLRRRPGPLRRRLRRQGGARVAGGGGDAGGGAGPGARPGPGRRGQPRHPAALDPARRSPRDRRGGLPAARRLGDLAADHAPPALPARSPCADVVPDSHVFAVATVDAEGNESLPVYPSKLE